MAENLDKIANILTDATVTFTTGNGSMVTIMNNIIHAESISPIATAITLTLD